MTTIDTDIKWNRETKDYDLYAIIDDVREYIGSAPNHHVAEERCNEYRYEYLTHPHTIETAVELLMEVAA